jgi:hypothetical protein
VCKLLTTARFFPPQARRQSKRFSFRSIPCEWEDGGVEVVEALAELSAGEAGWVLVGYRPDGATLYLQAKSQGSVKELVPWLKDDEQQYVQVRFMDTGKDPNLSGSLMRDVLITWSGKNISAMKKGKYFEHKEIVWKMFDTHAHLTCNGERRNITLDLIRERSDPLSGSHEL